jgi:hypothetical protein
MVVDILRRKEPKPEFLVQEVVKEVAINPYTTFLDLDLNKLDYTLAKSSDLLLTTFTNFTYILPEQFIRSGNPQIKNITVYHDQDNIEGIQFVFTNNAQEQTTELFGKTQDRQGKQTVNQTITFDLPLTLVRNLLIS